MTKNEALKLALKWYDSGHEDRKEFQELIENLLAAQPAVPLTDEQAHQTLLDMAKHIETFGDESLSEAQLSAECLRFILKRVAAHGIKENT